MEDSVRWSLKVLRETDEALRAYLRRAGGRKGALSRFIEDAVQAKLTAALRARKGDGASRSVLRREFADALKSIRVRTGMVSQQRFEKLAAQALAHARKPR